jgi:hypothetical protein
MLTPSQLSFLLNGVSMGAAVVGTYLGPKHPSVAVASSMVPQLITATHLFGNIAETFGTAPVQLDPATCRITVL